MHEELFTRSGLSFERLKSLCEIASRGGISKAAGGDPVKQSQFSRQLRELEIFFDVELTQRRGRNAELTPAGRELAALSREILDSLVSFSGSRRSAQASLRLGTGESWLQWLVLPRIARLQAAIPNTVFSFRNLKGEDVITQLQESQIDFGILADGATPDGIKTTKLGVMRYRLFVGARPGSKASKLQWQEVMTRSFVGLEGEGRQMREIRALAERHGVELKPSVLCSSLPNVASVLGQDDGFAILPEAAEQPGLVAVDAPFLPKLSRSIVLAWSERRITTRDAMPKWRRVLSTELSW